MKTAITIILLILITGAIYLGSTSYKNTSTLPSSNRQTYTDADFGISFTYPDTYEIREGNGSKGGRLIYEIALMKKTDLANVPQDGEGPTSITVGVFSNNENKSLDGWIKSDNFSNFQLSPDKVLTPQTLGGKPSLAYTWDGLYRGESIATVHKDNVIVLSVTSLTPSDSIRTDFTNLLSTITFN